MAESSGIRPLPTTTARLIASSQVITSVVSVVKELIENSLDAGGTNIEIRLENYGFDKIEVRDNGAGICPVDAEFMGRPHCTSKLSGTQDLESLTTYGFRGEALGSLCSVANVAITTKTVRDDFGTTYTLDTNGCITDTQPSHLGQGTTVVVTQLFRRIPVRKQYYSAPKRRKEELRKVEDLLIAYSVIKYDVRFVLRHNRDTLWQKTAVSSPKDVLLKVLGTATMANMMHFKRKGIDPEFEIELYLPKAACDHNLTSRTSSDRCYIFINQRPVIHKSIEKTLKRYYIHAVDCDQSRCPVAFVSVVVPPSGLDVNLEPNKMKVLIQNQVELLEMLQDILEEIYGSVVSKPSREKLGTAPSNHREANFEEALAVASRTQDDSVELSDHSSNRNVQIDSSLHLPKDPDKAADSFVPFETDIMDLGPDQWESSVQEKTVANKDTPNIISLEKSSSGSMLQLEMPSRVKTDDFEISTQTESATFNLLETSILDSDDDNLFDSALLADVLGIEGQAQGEGQTVNPNHQQKEFSEGTERSRKTLGSVEGQLKEHYNGEPGDHGHASDMAYLQNSQSVSDQSKRQPLSDPGHFKTGIDSGSVIEVEINKNRDLRMGDAEEKIGEPKPSTRDWSRGEALQGADGKKIEPVKMFLPRGQPVGEKTPIRGQGHVRMSSASKITQAANSPGQATLYDLVNSEPIKRPTTAFIYFSREIRPAIVEKNPGADFKEIAKIIGQQWKALGEADRQKYEQLMSKDVVRYHEEKASQDESFGCGGGTARKRRKRESLPFVMQGQQFSSPRSLRKEAKLAPRETVQLSFSLNGLKDRFAAGFKSSQAEGTGNLHLVGELKASRCWVGVDGGHLTLIMPGRVQEMLIYHQLMETHMLPTNRLEDPIHLSSQMVGGDDVWRVLQGLMTSQRQQTDPYTYCVDPRLIRNGFSIRASYGPASEPKLQVISLATCINTLGVPDLGEILKVILTDAKVTVTKARPSKVCHYLQGEAVRMARQVPLRVSAEEVKELLAEVRTRLPEGSTHCFHHRPFLHHLYSLGDLPPSQA